ncbi:hypothetical protein LCGC14_1454200 [marine sediment metagenome]|uniref:Uncharacterized protein n=1 Tax=marine sediment metagenome TaxID=412755 RepID=A0A0F9JGX3_9ZZZZ
MKGRGWLNPTTKRLEQIPDILVSRKIDQSVLLEENVYFAGAPQINSYYKFTYFRSAAQKAGSKMSYVLQKTNARVISTGAHQKIVSGAKSVVSLAPKTKSFSYVPDTSTSSELSQRGFTKETQYELFTLLFDPQFKLENNKVVPLAMNNLDILNGFFKSGSLDSEFGFGPDIKRVNFVINELGLDLSKLQKLIWKTSSGDFLKSQSLKGWLNDIYAVLINYDNSKPDADPIIKKFSKQLIELSKRFDYETLEASSKKSSQKEINMAKVIFEAIQSIFGHFTIRLMFANMIDFYGDAGNFKIKIKNRPVLQYTSRKSLSSYLKHIGLVTPSAQSESPLNSLKGRNDVPNYSPMHIFGLFFLDSYIYLPLKTSSVKLMDNALIFNTGPLVAIDSVISANTPRKLSTNIARDFATSYLTSYTATRDMKIPQLVLPRFIESQKHLFEFIKKEIKSQVEDANYLGDKGKSVRFATEIVKKARMSIFDPDFTKGQIRYQIEKSLTDLTTRYNEYQEIIFHGIIDPNKGGNFVLKISQIKLLESNFQSWGYIKNLHENNGFFKHSKNPMYIDNYIIDTADNIGTKISKFASGKARIYILHDTGDPNLGYQYLKPQTSHATEENPNGLVYVEALKHMKWIPKVEKNSEGKDDRTKIRTYFDVDLNPKNSKDKYILQHLVKVVLSTTDIIVVKEEGASWSDSEYTFAFNQYGFLSPSQIHSGSGTDTFYGSDKTGFRLFNYQMNLVKQTASFNSPLDWLLSPGWTFGGGSDFHQYLNNLFANNDDYSKLLEQYLSTYG